MARTPSTMLPLGTIAPSFSLPNVETNEPVSLNDISKKPATLVMFISRHCPFVKHILEGLSSLGKDYGDKIGMVAISSNDVKNYPDDAPALLAKMANESNFTFPVLFDDSQEVAKQYQAACTPDFFLFDGNQKLVYRGQLDDSRPGTDIPVTGEDLRNAINAVLAGESVADTQKPSIGCNIKWKAGNEPDYFNA